MVLQDHEMSAVLHGRHDKNCLVHPFFLFLLQFPLFERLEIVYEPVQFRDGDYENPVVLHDFLFNKRDDEGHYAPGLCNRFVQCASFKMLCCGALHRAGPLFSAFPFLAFDEPCCIKALRDYVELALVMLVLDYYVLFCVEAVLLEDERRKLLEILPLDSGRYLFKVGN